MIEHLSKKKTPSLSSLKKKAWKYCSLYIRLFYSDGAGYVTCVTCQSTKHYKEMQAGHFIPGRGNAILFDTRGIHPQCYGCNVGQKGRPREYDAFMKKKYGQKVVKELDSLAKTTVKFMPIDLIVITENFKSKIRDLGYEPK